jgi:hypothetical protein
MHQRCEVASYIWQTLPMTSPRFLNFHFPCAAAGLLVALLCSPVWAVHKCTVNNSTVYQELPCEQNLATVARDLMKKESNEALHRRLDSMLASGVGVKGKADRMPQEAAAVKSVDVAVSAPAEDEKFKSQPRSSANREAKQAEAGRRSYQQALEQNGKASARMQKDYDDMLVLCSGKTFKNPVVGMSDEQFRMCTLPNRMGAIEKVVVAEEKGVPLRLYISPTQAATRVYSIGGVVTAVKP